MIDCRMVLGGDTFISVVSLYDGPDGVYIFLSASKHGRVTVTASMGLQDDVLGDHSCSTGFRVVRRPGVDAVISSKLLPLGCVDVWSPSVK